MNEKFVRLSQLIDIVGLRRSAIYKKVNDGEFPAPVRLGCRAVAWVKSEIDKWIKDRIAERDGGQA